MDNYRLSGLITAKVLQETKQQILDGMLDGTEINTYVEQTLKLLGGTPAFKGYGGFPSAICLSLNETVLHGIPSGQTIKPGDLVSLDVGTIYQGAYSDAAISFVYKQGYPALKAELVNRTRMCLDCAITRLQCDYPVCKLSSIADAIESGARARFKVIDQYGGHGIGTELHQDFFVPNTLGALEKDIILQKGQILCIEPMLCVGQKELYKESDGWSIRTADRFPTAHFEHTVRIGETGIEILTKEE